MTDGYALWARNYVKSFTVICEEGIDNIPSLYIRKPKPREVKAFVWSHTARKW